MKVIQLLPVSPRIRVALIPKGEIREIIGDSEKNTRYRGRAVRQGSSLLLTHVSVKSEIPEECWHFVAGRDGNSEAFYPGFLSVGTIRQSLRILD
jgi:hypothetical protein